MPQLKLSAPVDNQDAQRSAYLLALGVTVAQLRGRRYTQDALARLVGISQGTLSRIEAGRTAVDTYVLYQLARALKTSAAYLLTVAEQGLARAHELGDLPPHRGLLTFTVAGTLRQGS